jgi:hypothetical protein
LKKKTETVRDTCHRVSRRHFGERHLVDDVCPGQYQPCHVFVTRCRKFSCGQC